MLLQHIPSFLACLSDENKTGLFGNPEIHAAVSNAASQPGIQRKGRPSLHVALTIYLVLSLSIFRDLSVKNVMVALFAALRHLFPRLVLRPVPESTMCERRYKLGIVPVKEVFDATTNFTPPPTFHGLRLWGVDGIRFAVADTPENAAEFGRPGSGRGTTGYPVARVVARYDLYGRRIAAMDIGAYNKPERDGLESILAGLGNDDLLLGDMGFPSGDVILYLRNRGVNFLFRIHGNWKPEIRRTLGVGDYIAGIKAFITLLPKKPVASQKGLSARRYRSSWRHHQTSRRD